MTELEKQLIAIGAQDLPPVVSRTKAWTQFCEHHSSLFEKALKRKPDNSSTSHLLGILTKAHIEVSSYIESNGASMQAMHQAFNDNLGKQHANKFEEQGMEQLALCTHLWLYLQGYLKLDFSLANDHAHNTSELISSVNNHDVQKLRTEFLASYYLGAEKSPVKASSVFKPLEWLKKWFN